MAEIRTGTSKVERLVGGKGVAIVETTSSTSGADFKLHMTAWLRENHGLQVGDSARFGGFLGVKKREVGDKVYVDINLNNAQVIAGTLQRAELQEDATAGDWNTATPGEPF